MSKRIAIIGGGYVGCALARALDDKADIALIEQNSHFVHAPAMIRAVIDPYLLEQALIPYDRLLKRGIVVQARAQSIEENGVVLDDGARIEADYIVVATGASNAAPFRPQSAPGSDQTSINALRADNADIHAALLAANHVAIVGAGAVGTELAGEISHFMPEKTVTLISSDAALFPGFPAKLGRQLLRKLRAAGVNVVLGARAENLESLSRPYAGTLKLDNGQSISADLIFPTIGARAKSSLLEPLPGIEKGRANRIKVDGWMRPSPSSLPNLFAAGDIAENGDAMTVVAATRQVPWLTKTLSALLEGQELRTLKPYSPWKNAPILLPLGPVKGNSFLSLFTAGDFITSKMKGQDLFVSKYRKALGY